MNDIGIYGYTNEELNIQFGEKVSIVNKRYAVEALECILRKGEYSGRIEMLMRTYLGRFDRIVYKCLKFCFAKALFPSMLIYPIFHLVFRHKIKLYILPFSSNSRHHTISINGRIFCLVGNSEQFGHQFISERKVLIEKIIYLH